MRNPMIMILGLVAMAGGFTSCRDDDGDGPRFVHFTTVGFGHSDEYPGLDDYAKIKPLEVVIRTQEAWEAFWKMIDDTELPEIDFSREMVIAVTMGGAASDDYDIEITAVYEKDGNYTVEVTETDPEESVFQIIDESWSDDVVPYHIVRLPRIDGVVKFKYTYVEEGEDDERADSLFPLE